MTEKTIASLRESKTARWAALAVVAFTMLCGYYLTDIMAPLKGLLEGQIGWSSSDFGFFNSAYGWFNVFLGMLIIGGILLDKLGVRITGLGAAIVMVTGTLIKYWAVSTHSLDGQMIIGVKSQVFFAGIGFATFARSPAVSLWLSVCANTALPVIRPTAPPSRIAAVIEKRISRRNAAFEA